MQPNHARWPASPPQADILEHREEQVRAAEGRCGDAAAQLERARAELAACQEEAQKHKVGGQGRSPVGDSGAHRARSEHAAGALRSLPQCPCFAARSPQAESDALQARVADAASMLTNKDTLEATVRAASYARGARASIPSADAPAARQFSPAAVACTAPPCCRRRARPLPHRHAPQVRQQAALIERLDRELKVARGLVEERSKAAAKAE
jgi:hypothetical protein